MNINDYFNSTFLHYANENNFCFYWSDKSWKHYFKSDSKAPINAQKIENCLDSYNENLTYDFSNYNVGWKLQENASHIYHYFLKNNKLDDTTEIYNHYKYFNTFKNI